MKEFIKRTITGVTLVALTIFLTLKGGLPLRFFIFIISIIGLREFYNVVDNICPSIRPVGYLSCILFLLESLTDGVISLNFIIAFIVISLLIFYIFNKNIRLSTIGSTIFSILYIPFLFQHIIYLDGDIHIWLIFIIAWGTDTSAYIVGNLLGRNKLYPSLSPHKTVEGAIGGVVGSVLLTVLFSQIFSLPPLLGMVSLALIGGILAQLGDLTASKIKREFKAKDYGFIIPGHGGILDRFDSILFIAPLVYYFIKVLNM